MIGKVGQFKKGWEWVTLSDEEKAKLYDKLIYENGRLFVIAYNEAKKIKDEIGIHESQILHVAIALFDKLATQSFSAINSELERKIFMEKKKEWERFDNKYRR
ncbi:MAG: hypothetical protein DRN14_02585 [Thermoplasmata archaeon]|nr:MAG: hypothetical protein DRN14_02585 [Thermoplasmata archaeon]